MAEILAFPLVRRRPYVRRQAEWFRQQGHRAAEANLYRQLQLQRDVLLKRDICPAEVEREVRALEAAIRAEVARLAPRPDVGS